jgi:hypothetical protein
LNISLQGWYLDRGRSRDEFILDITHTLLKNDKAKRTKE